MRRVNVVGSSGSGKSALGRALAERLDAPYVELDAIFHQPNWTPLPIEQFRARVAEIVAGDTWVIDGSYSAVRDLVWPRTDTLVWLDLPRWKVMWQLSRRTVVRMARRQELWNGNREQWRNLVSRDAEKNILIWSWTHHATHREQMLNADPHLDVVRLGDRPAAAAFLRPV